MSDSPLNHTTILYNHAEMPKSESESESESDLKSRIGSLCTMIEWWTIESFQVHYQLSSAIILLDSTI